jgi:hypothetical protein
MTIWSSRRHFRALRDRLIAERFEIVDAWMGRHLRVRVRRDGREVTLTCGGTPMVAEHAIENTVKQARRGTR